MMLPFPLELQEIGTRRLSAELLTKIRQLILQGRLSMGEKLPATRIVAQAYGISRGVVVSTYDILTAEGYVESRTGQGSFVANWQPQQVVRQNSIPDTPTLPPLSDWANSLPEKDIDRQAIRPFIIGLTDLDDFPFDQWARLSTKFWKSHPDLQVGAVGTKNEMDLRQTLAVYLYRQRGIECLADQIFIFHSMGDALSMIARMIWHKGDQVLIETPGYPPIKDVLEQLGAKVGFCPVDRAGMRTDHLSDHLQARGVIVCPAAHFPLGYRLSARRRSDILAWADQTQSWIIEDDYGHEFLPQQAVTPPLRTQMGNAQLQRSIFLGSFSKTLFPDIRLSYAIVPKHLCVYLARAYGFQTKQASKLIQPLVAGFMHSGGYVKWQNFCQKRYAARQKEMLAYLAAHMPQLPFCEPPHMAGGMAIFIPLKAGFPVGTDQLLADYCRDQGIDVRALTPFYLQPEPPKQPYLQGLLLGANMWEGAVLAQAVADLSIMLQKAMQDLRGIF